MSHNASAETLGRAPLSSAVEDYLKAIHALREDGLATISTQAIANRLGVSPPSATAMLKRLDTLGLAHHEPYHGVHLSAAGEKIALEIVRHHRIIETFLSEILGVEWDKLHDEAERLEHVISEELEAKMAAKLGHPTRDPHGAPIPTLDGQVELLCEVRLSETPVGFRGQISRVADEDPAVLRHLRDLGLQIGTALAVARAEKPEGVIRLDVSGREITLGALPAAQIWVKLLDSAAVGRQKDAK